MQNEVFNYRNDYLYRISQNKIICDDANKMVTVPVFQVRKNIYKNAGVGI